MKKIWVLLLFVILLTGCGAKETFETVNDLDSAAPAVSPQEISLPLPEEASLSVMDNGQGGKLYQCDGYVLTVQTMAAGDLDETLRQTTGFTREGLTLMETLHQGAKRYDCVWSAAGEAGDQVCRAVILDDGVCHYVVSVMAPAAQAGPLQHTWRELLDGISLVNTD